MQQLIHGIHAFRTSYFEANRALFEQLAGGQKPEVLFITCADSRVVPDLITNAAPGTLFTVRNAGNVIPPFQPPCPPALSGAGEILQDEAFGGGFISGEAASAEYAIEVLGVKDVIVCGHTGCGAMHAILHPEDCMALGFVRAWVHHARETRVILDAHYGHLSGDALVQAAVEENVLVQLENLRTYPFVRERLESGAIRLHGWVFEIGTGGVHTYDPVAEEFVPLGAPAGAP